MKAVIVGAGRMGRAAAWDLARQKETEALVLVDRSAEALEAAVTELRGLLPGRAEKVTTLCCELDTGSDANAPNANDAKDAPASLRAAFEDATVALSAADYRYHERLTRLAIETGTHLCDLGGNLTVVDAQLALCDEAERAGITVIPDCGIAPGLACMVAAWGVSRLDRVERVAIRVGGLPAHPKPPLKYKLVFSPRGLLNEYLEPAEVLRGGERVSVPSLTEVETVTFPEPFGELEAFTTSGGASTLPRTLQGRVPDLDYKTLRYPGHVAAFAGMQALGLLSEERLELGGGATLVPRELIERLVAERLSDDDTDVLLMRVVVEGLRDEQGVRLVFELIDRHDPTTGHSAMARTTAYSAAAVATLLGTGRVRCRGVVPGESALPLAELMEAVRARGLALTERCEAR